MGKDKLLRVQGRRSRGGCLVCKKRHLKCDEGVPACDRCIKANRVCQYADKPSSGVQKFVLYTLPGHLHLSMQVPNHERRALWHFQHRTIEQLEGPFPSELWSIIVPRLAQTDVVVRQSVIALSSFHEHYLNPNSTENSHLQLAESFYQNAQKRIVAMEAPERHFDSILAACIIFSACEGLRGNFSIATKHAIAGMRMIADQVTNFQRHDYVFRNAEENLFHIFLELQAQVMDANDDDFAMECPTLVEQMGSVPDRFTDPGDALAHLQILINQFVQLSLMAEAYHENDMWTASHIAPALQPVYGEFQTSYDAWTKAVSYIKKPDPEKDTRQFAGYLLLTIFATFFEIDQHVFIHGETTYDNQKEKIIATLDLVAKFLELRGSPTSVTYASKLEFSPVSFSSSPEVIPILFELAIRTRVPELYERALSLLRSSKWREGVWDSYSAANLAEQVVVMKRDGAERAACQVGNYKFLISDIIPLSEGQCLIYSGLKPLREGSFSSFWLETIEPDEGQLQSCVLNIG